MEQTKKKKILNIQSIVGIIAGVGAMIFVQQFFFSAPTFDKAMMQAAGELNKSCPIMVDSETRLDNAVTLPENIFQYNYTLITAQKDSLNIEALQAYIEPRLINTVKTTPELKPYRDNKVTMAYQYKDKNGVFLFKVLVTPDKYKE